MKDDLMPDLKRRHCWFTRTLERDLVDNEGNRSPPPDGLAKHGIIFEEPV